MNWAGRSTAKIAMWLFLLTLVLFVFNMDGTWILDDHYQIEQNPYLKSLSSVGHIFTTKVWQSTSLDSEPSDIYRPIFMLTYLVEYQLFGPEPWAFHLFNNVIHALNVVLLFLLVRRFSRTEVALGAALLFGIHPIVTEAVSWVGGLMDLLCAFFALLFCYSYFRSCSNDEKNRAVWQFAALLFVPLGFFSKEVFVFIPLGVLCIERLHAKKWMWRSAIPYLAVVALCFVWRQQMVEKSIASLVSPIWWVNFLALTKRFLWLLIANPSDLDFLNGYTPQGWSHTRIVFESLILVCAVGVFFWKGRCQAKALLPMLFIFAPLAAVALIVDLTGLLSERYLYLPAIGGMWLISELGVWLWEIRKPLVFRFFVAWCVLLAGLTILRNREWKNEIELYSSSMERRPSSDLPHYYMAIHYRREGNVLEEMRAYQGALQRQPRNVKALNNLAVRWIEFRNFVEAENLLKAALQIEPTRAKTYFNFGFLFETAGQKTKAVQAYARALQLDPNYNKASAAISRIASQK